MNPRLKVAQCINGYVVFYETPKRRMFVADVYYSIGCFSQMWLFTN